MRTKKTYLALFAILITNTLNAQTIKLENGVSISSLRNDGVRSFNKKVYSYNPSLQIDYLEKNWFYLSSSIGYLEKGGKDEILIIVDADDPGSIFDNILKFNYITANTLFNSIYKLNKIGFYLGVGPRIDFRINSQYTTISGKKSDRNFIYGMKCATGILYELNKDVQLGLNFSYLPSFIKPVESNFLKERTFTLGVSVGYKL